MTGGLFPPRCTRQYKRDVIKIQEIESYYSTGGAGGYGSYASDGECSYFSSGGMSINTCDNW